MLANMHFSHPVNLLWIKKYNFILIYLNFNARKLVRERSLFNTVYLCSFWVLHDFSS